MKYPSIHHLPYSLTVAKEDKYIPEAQVKALLEQPVVVTEKLDGGNTCIKGGTVYARSHLVTANHPSFDWIKNQYSYLDIPKDFYLFGENMYAIHNIEYKHLDTFFYAFDVYDPSLGLWLDIASVRGIVEPLGLRVVPVVYQGRITPKDLEELINEERLRDSSVGGPREGFVVRQDRATSMKEFQRSRAKWVRKDHVRKDEEHWSRHWRKAKLNPR